MSKQNKQKPAPVADQAPAPNLGAQPDLNLSGVRLVYGLENESENEPKMKQPDECQPCPWTKENGRSIFEFQQDDIIIYVLPKTRVTYESDRIFYSFGSVRREEPDNTFRRPFRLLAVKNNIIYLRQINQGGSGPIVHASLETMESGWELFEIPANLTIDDVCGTPLS